MFKQRVIYVALFLSIFTHITSTSIFAANPKLHVEVGLNHFYKNRYLEAYREFRAALNENPNYPEAHYNLGRVYKLQGFAKEALIEFQTAVQLKPNYTAARRELEILTKAVEADIDAQLKMQGRENVSNTSFDRIPSGTIEAKAKELLNQGKINEAIKYYELLRKERPNDVNTFKMLGYLYFRQNKFTNSLDNYIKAGKLAPGDAEIPYASGLVYMKTGQPKKAQKCFTQALKLYPKMVKACFALGESYEAQGRTDDAVFMFKKCLEMNPNLTEANEKLKYLAGKQGYNYFSRGAYYYQKGDYENALSMLSTARSYGLLTPDQTRQVNEMINTCRYWVDKQMEERKVKAEMEQVRSDANVSMAIDICDVTRNSGPYIGKAVEWSGSVEEFSRGRRQSLLLINTNNDVNPESNMDYCFVVYVSKALPRDERISTNSEVTVTGKIVKVDKLKYRSTFSSRRQPVLEASEITFTRKDYAEPLVIRF